MIHIKRAFIFLEGIVASIGKVQLAFKMMKSPFKELVKNLPQDRFGILVSVFPNLPSSELNLLKQKRCHFSDVCGQKKFCEKSLQSFNESRNPLGKNAVTINQENLEHAKTMCSTLKCQILQDFHAAYLKTNCTIPACIFVFLRERERAHFFNLQIAKN